MTQPPVANQQTMPTRQHIQHTGRYSIRHSHQALHNRQFGDYCLVTAESLHVTLLRVTLNLLPEQVWHVTLDLVGAVPVPAIPKRAV